MVRTARNEARTWNDEQMRDWQITKAKIDSIQPDP